MSAAGSVAGDPPPTGVLPPYRAVLVVDAKQFSDSDSAWQPVLNLKIEQVLEAAFARAGLVAVWHDRRFSAHTGDGYVLGLLPEHLPRLIHPFLRELQAELRERDQRRLASEPRLRLRASIHVGPLPDAGSPSDGVGKPMTDTHRLLDSEEVRRALDQTHEDVTFLAVIVSRRVYEDVIAGGYTGLHRAEFREVVAKSKRFEESAYLHVPQPSGRLLSDEPDRAASTSAANDVTVRTSQTPTLHVQRDLSRRVKQRAKASGKSRITQVGGDQHNHPGGKSDA